ncbi:unnamed protein product [Protopolystoma xenopodis]|uniref:Uncharacterized protein n=1 Tax=Protopolystoma xenopodis TaxID=117903 RepID=A0A3S4ZZ01_9PLAT|nr:unnamed protein product [Protopolystoma xenopodis]
MASPENRSPPEKAVLELEGLSILVSVFQLSFQVSSTYSPMATHGDPSSFRAVLATCALWPRNASRLVHFLSSSGKFIRCAHTRMVQPEEYWSQ